jgi:hypothetical protein
MFDLLNILNLVLTQLENSHRNVANIDPLPFLESGRREDDIQEDREYLS